MEATNVITSVKKPNSFEFGKAGSRLKIYYDMPEELKGHIQRLKELDLIDEIETGFATAEPMNKPINLKL